MAVSAQLLGQWTATGALGDAMLRSCARVNYMTVRLRYLYLGVQASYRQFPGSYLRQCRGGDCFATLDVGVNSCARLCCIC